MFGHRDDDNKQDDQQAPAVDISQDQTVDNTAPVATTDEPTTNQPDWQHPGTPLGDQAITPVQPDDSGAVDSPPSDPTQISDVISPAGGFPRSTDTQAASHFTVPSPSFSTPDEPKHDEVVNSANSELVDIKQKALSELSPLLDQLDQPPEDKFRTLMMMIQASDDESLVEKAYAAAHSIEDEKVRAQALLDIVNEINYFTSAQPEA